MRQVEPVGFVGSDQAWYLSARCRLRDGGRVFRVDRILAVRPTGEIAPERPFEIAEDGTATFGQYAIPYVEVPDVKAAVEQATAAGATVVVPPTTHGPTLTAHITDPAGNRIGLFHMLETPGGAAG